MKLYDELVARGLIAQVTNEEEIREMIDDGEEIEVKCHFCDSAYHFTVEELKELLKKAKRRGR